MEVTVDARHKVQSDICHFAQSASIPTNAATDQWITPCGIDGFLNVHRCEVLLHSGHHGLCIRGSREHPEPSFRWSVLRNLPAHEIGACMCYYGWITKDWREYLREDAFHITRIGEENIPCAQDQRACLHDYVAHVERSTRNMRA